MHHKRKRPKSSRAGCLLCKPWKRQGAKGPGKLMKVLGKHGLEEQEAVEVEKGIKKRVWERHMEK